jgi:hypothetical protein
MDGIFARRRAKKHARKVAAELWRKHRDVDACTAELNELAKSDPQLVGLDPATIFLLIQMAIRLWLWWRDFKEDNPSDTPQAGEPWQEDVDDV